jgi:hypothetical protein
MTDQSQTTKIITPLQMVDSMERYFYMKPFDKMEYTPKSANQLMVIAIRDFIKDRANV